MQNNYKIFSLNKFRKIKNNSYDSKEECLKHQWKYGALPTNPRFKLFDQVYFYAGDNKDIDKYGLLPLRYCYSDETAPKTINKDKVFKLYKKIDYNSVNNTFQYMFQKFKKGIFVIIRDNKLIVYLPFSNANYRNNWIKQTYFSEEEKRLLSTVLSDADYQKIKPALNKSIIEFMKKYPGEFKRGINFNREEWYSGNCSFRNEQRKYEGELNVNVFKNMLESLLVERTIPNVEFFINDRDFPLLKRDYTEPYEHLYDGEKVPIEDEYKFKKMAPIFSKSVTDKFADLLIPTNDDWIMASRKFFTEGCSSNAYYDEKWNKKWSSKKGMCIFRGSATGCGITVENNPRLKAASIGLGHRDILDIGITDWNARAKKYMGRPIEIIDTSKLGFKIANKINNIEKSNYKYILNIDGHVSAFRLSSELSMNSVVLLVKSPYKMWFSDWLEEYVHYVPVKADLSDMVSQVQWCIANDAKCEVIAGNAVAFFNKHLTKDGIFNYLEAQLGIIYSQKNFKNLLDVKKARKKIAIITCFRDSGNGAREAQRRVYIQIMTRILKPYCDFKIYIIEQSDDGELFNIGKLKNIGFEIASREYDYDNYIFSDIDLIPNYDLIKYFTEVTPYPMSLAIGSRYLNESSNYGKAFLGGLLKFDGATFRAINGYMNSIYGWGKEDDALANRLVNAGIGKILYPKEGRVIDIEEVGMKTLTIDEKLVTVSGKKDIIAYEKLCEDLTSWNTNGLNGLQYKVLGKDDIMKDVVQVKVDLLKKQDEKKYPHFFKFNFGSDFDRLYREVKDRMKKLSYEKK